MPAANRWRLAATSLPAPSTLKITADEAAVLISGFSEERVSHTLRLKDDSVIRHGFWAWGKEDYEGIGLTVTPYGKNSALLTKGV